MGNHTQAATQIVSNELYRSEGFTIHPEPVIPPNVVDAAVCGMDEVREGRYDTGVPPQPSSWNPGDDPGSKLCKIEMPQIANHAIMDLIKVPALGALAAEVTGARAVQVWWVQLLYKPPASAGTDAGFGIGWHQDRHYWQAWEEGSELFTGWVALSDVTADAGPISFVRRSHRWGYIQGASDFLHEADQDELRSRIERETGERWMEVPAILPPGGMSIHHNLTYHGSATNRTSAPRRSLAIHMRTQDSRPKDGCSDGVARFVHRLDYSPVVYGDSARFRT